jgi:hypothetical protein
MSSDWQSLRTLQKKRKADIKELAFSFAEYSVEIAESDRNCSRDQSWGQL